MRIRPLTEQDFPAIDALAESVWGDDAEAEAKRPPGWSRRDFVAGGFKDVSQTLVVEQDGKTVAAGKIAGNPSFPRRHLRISVHPEYRRQGIGTALFKTLTEAGQDALFIREWHDDPATIAFYKSLGFTEAEHCTEGWIYPEHPETKGWIEDALANVPAHLKVLPADDSNSPATRLEIARLMDDDFIRSQTWVPARPQTDEKALEVFLGGSLPDTLFCAYSDGELRGAATLSKPLFADDPGSAHFWRVSLADISAADAPVIAKSLIAHCLNAALQRNLRVQVEQTNLDKLERDCYHSIPGTDLVEDMSLMVYG